MVQRGPGLRRPPFSHLLHRGKRNYMVMYYHIEDLPVYVKDKKMNLQTPVWDNTNVYLNFEDPKIAKDLLHIETTLNEIEKLVSTIKDILVQPLISNASPDFILKLQQILRAQLDLQNVAFTIRSYASFAISTNARNEKALGLSSQANQLQARQNQIMKPVFIYLQMCEDQIFESFIQSPLVSELEFALRQERLNRTFALSSAEEELMESFSLDGYHAWGKLYSELSSTIQTDWNGKKTGLADLSSFLFQGDRDLRESAYKKIQSLWKENQITAATILNSIYGWRVQDYKNRSKVKTLHYLDQTCRSERIEPRTLETLMNVTKENRSVGQAALKIMAKEMKVEKLGPWDILAPFPETKQSSPVDAINFSDAMQIITDSFAEFDSELADFAQMAWKKGWIDATKTENRKTGAYCGGFVSPREPRVFQTFQGSMKDVITLAHELGHAYHNWVMRDLPISQCHYTSGLAETASVFAETLVRSSLVRRAKTNHEKKKILWHEVEAATQFTINIPARFEFEKMLFDARAKKSVQPEEMSTMMTTAWKAWYGDTLSEYNSMYWAEKLHFAITRISFYNYPYLFGYLFSLGVYASKDSFGSGFKKMYVELLRDTGRMRPEDLIKKHMNQDLNSPQFWQNSMNIAKKSIQDYQALQD